MLFHNDNRDDGLRNTSNEDFNLEEGSRNSKKNSISNFIDDVSHMVAGFNVVNSSSNHNSGGERKTTQ